MYIKEPSYVFSIQKKFNLKGTVIQSSTLDILITKKNIKGS